MMSFQVFSVKMKKMMQKDLFIKTLILIDINFVFNYDDDNAGGPVQM